MNASQRVRGSFDITRPANAFAAGILTGIGAFVGGDPTSFEAIAAVVATILATGSGNTINDYFDREIDAINTPHRPLPRGAISPRWALIQATVMMVIAVGLAFTLPLLAIAIALFNLVALATYTSFFKGLPGVGNAVVAVLVGSTFVFGGAAVDGFAETIVLFILAALATLGREIIKDIEDITGDRAEGLQTLPIAIGESQAVGVAISCLLIAAASSPAPYVLGIFGIWYLVVVTPAIVTMLLGGLLSRENPARGQRLIKVGMYLAILAFVVGRIELLV